MGFAVICPHTMTHRWDENANLEYEDFIGNSLVLLNECDALFLIGDWCESYGAVVEREFALRADIPIFECVTCMKHHFSMIDKSKINPDRPGGE